MALYSFVLHIVLGLASMSMFVVVIVAMPYMLAMIKEELDISSRRIRRKFFRFLRRHHRPVIIAYAVVTFFIATLIQEGVARRRLTTF